MNVVYHVASMGAPWYWRYVVADQARALVANGLTAVRLSHVGPDLADVLKIAADAGLKVDVVHDHKDLRQYESHAMAEVDRLAHEKNEPILYLHTKGVSAPDSMNKLRWRKTMEFFVVEKWRENLTLLKDYDCVGFNWCNTRWNRAYGHYSGTFWTANAPYIRSLPRFWEYYRRNNGSRFACETWIGANPTVKPFSHAVSGWNIWHDTFDWQHFGQWDFSCRLLGPEPQRT